MATAALMWSDDFTTAPVVTFIVTIVSDIEVVVIKPDFIADTSNGTTC